MKAREIGTEIGTYEAKTHLSKIVGQVERGKVFFITRRGKRIAELRPVTETKRRPVFGKDKGRVFISDDFDDPLPEFEPYM